MQNNKLILTCLTGTPKTKNTNEKIRKSNKELKKFSKNDIESLKKEEFGDTFHDALVCETVIYLDQETGRQSFNEVMKDLIKDQKIDKKLSNLAINFSGHGALDVIGGKADNDEIDRGPKTLANMIYNSISGCVNSSIIDVPETVHFYFRNCNSAYPNDNPNRTSDSVNKNDIKQLYLGNSLVGLFTLRLKQVLKKDENKDTRFPFKASGFLGYLGDTEDSNPKVSSKIEGGKSFDAKDCRLIFSCPDSCNNDVGIIFPSNKKMLGLLQKKPPKEAKDDDEISNHSVDEECYGSIQEISSQIKNMKINNVSKNKSTKKKIKEVVNDIMNIDDNDSEFLEETMILNAEDIILFTSFLTLCYLAEKCDSETIISENESKKIDGLMTSLKGVDIFDEEIGSNISESFESENDMLDEELLDYLISDEKISTPTPSPKAMKDKTKAIKDDRCCVIS